MFDCLTCLKLGSLLQVRPQDHNTSFTKGVASCLCTFVQETIYILNCLCDTRGVLVVMAVVQQTVLHCTA